MRSAARFLLTLMLALAIPMQGFAAASMLLCGPGHGRMLAGAHHAADAYGAPDPHNHHDSASHAGHPGGHAAHGGASVVADHDGGRTAPLDGKPAFGKCSLCASCCAGSVIVDTLSPVAFEAGDRVLRARVVDIGAGIVPPTLERPPRT